MRKTKLSKKFLQLIIGGSLLGYSNSYAADFTNQTILAGPGENVTIEAGSSLTTNRNDTPLIKVNGGNLTGSNLVLNGTTNQSGLGGIMVSNGGHVKITGDSIYNYHAGGNVNDAFQVRSGSTVSLDGMNVNVSGVNGAVFAISDPGSLVTFKNGNIVTTNGSVARTTSSTFDIENTNIDISGGTGATAYSISIQADDSQFHAKNSTITSTRLDSGYGAILNVNSNTLTTLEDVRFISTQGHRVLYADGHVIGNRVFIDYVGGTGTSDRALGISENGVLELTNSKVQIGEGTDNTGALVNSGGKMILDNTTYAVTADGVSGLQVNYEDSLLILKNNSSLITEGIGVVSAFGGKSTSGVSTDNQTNILIDKSTLTSNDSWAVQGQNGKTGITVTGENASLNSGVGKAIRMIGITNESKLDIKVDQAAVLNGSVLAESRNAVLTEVQINLANQASWIGDAQTSGAEATLNADISSKSIWTGAVTGDGTTNIALSDEGIWKMTSNSTVKNLTVAGGKVQLANINTGFTTLTADELSGSGTFIMAANLAQGQGDQLVVTGSSAGNHNLVVNNQGSAQVDKTRELTVIETSDGIANFSLVNQVEVGGFLYDLHKVNTNWNLYTKGSTTTTGSASINNVLGTSLVNYVENQALMQRMGDLRTNASTQEVWARVYGGEFGSRGTRFSAPFSMSYSGLQVGADRKISLKNEKGTIYAGGMFGYTTGSMDYQSGGGSVDSKSVGIYGTYVAPSGFYADLAAKYSWINNDFSVLDTQKKQVTASGIDTNGTSVSLEIGKRFYMDQKIKEGWYFEPQAQMTLGNQKGAKFTASNGLQVDIDSFHSTLGRVGTLVGYEVKSGKNPINFYGKASYVHEFSGDLSTRFNGIDVQDSFGSSWLVYGMGATTQVGGKHNFYLDLEKSAGGAIKQKWVVSGGYRFIW